MQDLIDLGREAAKIFDRIVIKQDIDMRGRSQEQIISLLCQGIELERPSVPVVNFRKEQDAVRHAIKHAKKDSFVTILTENISEVLKLSTACLKPTLKYFT